MPSERLNDKIEWEYFLYSEGIGGDERFLWLFIPDFPNIHSDRTKEIFDIITSEVELKSNGFGLDISYDAGRIEKYGESYVILSPYIKQYANMLLKSQDEK